MDSLWHEINTAIHRRDIGSVEELIPKYLKLHGSTPEAAYEASEFYRKITDFKNALRVLPKEHPRASISRESDAEIKVQLQLARLLNILGASNYALRMIERIRAENRNKSKIEIVEIYHTNYKYEEIVELLGMGYPVPTSEPWHQDWLLHFYLSYALNETKRTDLAIARLDQMKAISGSPLIRAMCLSYRGKYLLSSGKLQEALHSLREAQIFFRDDDPTADHGILQTFLGECFFKLRRYAEARAVLKSAFKILHKPGVKIEEWIEIPLIIEKIPASKSTKYELVSRLSALFGPGYPPLNQSESVDGEDLLFSIKKIEKQRKVRHFDNASDVVWSGTTARLGFDLIDKLICYLTYAGEYGLPQFKVYELLWPDELFSFKQHQKRLERLVGRAREQGFKILWKDFHLRLISENVTATSSLGKVIQGRSFLIAHATFTRGDVEKYFSMSRTTAIVLCRQWLRSGAIEAVDKTRYRTRNL